MIDSLGNTETIVTQASNSYICFDFLVSRISVTLKLYFYLRWEALKKRNYFELMREAFGKIMKRTTYFFFLSFLSFLSFFFFVTVAAFVVVTAIGSLLFLVWTPSFSHHRPCFYAAWRPYNTKGLKKYGLLTALFKGTKYSVTILKAVSHFLGHNKRLEWLFNFVSGNLRLCAHGSRNNRIGVKCKVIPVYFVFCI